jgi:hypothetical protein
MKRDSSSGRDMNAFTSMYSQKNPQTCRKHGPRQAQIERKRHHLKGHTVVIDISPERHLPYHTSRPPRVSCSRRHLGQRVAE